MLRILEAQAPAKQKAADSISVLGDRLNNATLLEDRRAAILGLRSFAKEYPASVASEALRGLISSLSKDFEDVDTVKIVLETLLMLFNPDSNNPEASPEIALWLADEFTQRQDNITIILDLLENNEFYSRLYSLQLIAAILAARPDRTQECILSAPLGTTRLVSVLDDPRDAVRNVGILLLTDITQYSTELQKLVAFENCFDRIFAVIESDGGLSQGGIVVQDCLSLLANLIRFNSSNQSLFRESGGVSILAKLLPSRSRTEVQAQDNDYWESPQKDKNIWGTLALLRLFLVKGSVGTQANQNSFYKYGILQKILDLAFETSTAFPIKAEALSTCAEIIRGNAMLQEVFAQFQVSSVNVGNNSVNGTSNGRKDVKVYIIDILLMILLYSPSSHSLNVRIAACNLIRAYFYNHEAIKLHFLRRAVAGHKSGEDETPNFLSALLCGTIGDKSTDSFGLWFSAIIAIHLLNDFPEGKELLMAVSEGDVSTGEEPLTCIQAITSNLIANLQRGEDDRVQSAYLMLLIIWLYEYPPAVSDFLGEGSSIQGLIQIIGLPRVDRTVIRGLSAFLLGIVYEFSTKDSPISRRTLQPLLISSLGREKYLDVIGQLRQHPLVREHDAADSSTDQVSSDICFDSLFVDFLKDNFSRLARAIDRDPNLEVPMKDDAIDRDLVDSLRGEIEGKSVTLERIESALLNSERKLEQEQADHKRDQDMAAAEMLRIKKINEALQKDMELEVKKVEDAYTERLYQQEVKSKEAIQKALKEVNEMHQLATEASSAKEQELNQQCRNLQKSLNDADQRQKATDSRLSDIVKRASELTTSLKIANEEAVKLRDTIGNQMEKLKEQDKIISDLKASQEHASDTISKMRSETEQGKIKIQDNEWAIRNMKTEITKLEENAKEKDKARNSVQAELDDLLIMLGDLEEKRVNDKKRLKEFGVVISEDNSEEEISNDEETDEVN